jgi:hypothetical protein
VLTTVLLKVLIVDIWMVYEFAPVTRFQLNVGWEVVKAGLVLLAGDIRLVGSMAARKYLAPDQLLVCPLLPKAWTLQ